MASHSQLKYGARLIDSYLENNATISSCCEVLNSLIFSTHEQHHNNSFLCAAVVIGQSNIPAGATIGSNHNSRSAEFLLARHITGIIKMMTYSVSRCICIQEKKC